MFIIDGHLDLSMNAMEWNRDLRMPLDVIKNREEGLKDKPDRGHSLVCFEELRRGNIGLVFATQLARCTDKNGALTGSGWYSPQQAWAQTQAQLAWYKEMEACGEMKMITNKQELEVHFELWNNGQPNDKKPIGYILTLEGADSLVDISYAEKAFNYGLRAIGPAHYGPGRYADGTDSTGHLNNAGKELLKEMSRLKMVLDVSHLNDLAFWDALDLYDGHIWASHNNCRALVNHNRQFSDEMISALIKKGVVIGAAFDAWMLVPDWKRGISTPKETDCSLNKVIDHIDHICQLAGNTEHVALGTDLDGGFGSEQCPFDLHTIAGLQKMIPLFQARGYSDSDIEKIMHGNWLKVLRQSLPD